MSKARGVFLPKVIKQNLDHLIDRKKVHLPSAVEYRIPPELANKFKDVNGRRRYRVDPSQTTTLTEPALASLTYMDVGLWAGDGPGEDASDATWGRRRDFGIICGRLAVLCSYAHEKFEGGFVTEGIGAPAKSPEFEKVKPLLVHLSSRKRLGRVVVTRALLGRTDLAEKPTDEKIHVFLGDLHAPVMTVEQRTYSDVKPRPAEYTMSSTPPSPYSSGPTLVETRPASKHPMRGRYNPGIIVRALLPFIARLLNATVDDLNQHSARRILTLPLLVENWQAILAILERIWAETPLGDSPDTEEEDLKEVEHWFELYHGAGKKGAEIFQNAGADLKDWLDLLVEYQRKGQTPPIRLLQLGDLFDLWMGLKCGFTASGAWNHTAAAKAFAEHWLKETEYHTNQSDAIHMLRKFDDWLSPTQKIHPVFLYGNHDNYMGTLFGLPAQFKDTGLVAQHGHQADDFNSDHKAKIGYLLTQAAFAVLAVRLLEDPMSALVAGIRGGIGPRLTFTEMALEEAVFKPILAGKKPAMTFVMGHTHEPVLQEIRVLEYIPANPPESPPPPAASPPSAAQHHKVQVTVRFRQVDVTHVGSEIGNKNWHMGATIRQNSSLGAGEVRRDLALFGSRPLREKETMPLGSGQAVSLEVGTERNLQISCCGIVEEVDPGSFQRWNKDHSLLCYGQKPDAHGGELQTDCVYTCVAAVDVPALTWGGTKTIKGVSRALGLKVTLELVWGNIVG